LIIPHELLFPFSGLDSFTFSPAVARELFDDVLTEEAAAVFEAAAAGGSALLVPPKVAAPIKENQESENETKIKRLSPEEEAVLALPPTIEEMRPGIVLVPHSLDVLQSASREASDQRDLTRLEALCIPLFSRSSFRSRRDA